MATGIVVLLIGLSWAGNFDLYTPDEDTIGTLCVENNPDFEEYRYKEKIPYCRRNVWGSLKDRIYRRYGIPKRCRDEYTIDHLIPLSLGGDNSEENLWPEHKEIRAQLRPQLEQELYNLISSGEIKQAKAVRIILEAKLFPPVEQLESFKPCQ